MLIIEYVSCPSCPQPRKRGGKEGKGDETCFRNTQEEGPFRKIGVEESNQRSNSSLFVSGNRSKKLRAARHRLVKGWAAQIEYFLAEQ